MSAWLIALTGFIYAFVAFDQGYLKNNIPMGITYVGYAIGNIGLFFLASK